MSFARFSSPRGFPAFLWPAWVASRGDRASAGCASDGSFPFLTRKYSGNIMIVLRLFFRAQCRASVYILGRVTPRALRILTWRASGFGRRVRERADVGQSGLRERPFVLAFDHSAVTHEDEFLHAELFIDDANLLRRRSAQAPGGRCSGPQKLDRKEAFS